MKIDISRPGLIIAQARTGPSQALRILRRQKGIIEEFQRKYLWYYRAKGLSPIPTIEQLIAAGEVYAVIVSNWDKPGAARGTGLMCGGFGSLENKTNQTRIEISDMTVRAWQILQEEVNPDEDLLSVIHDLNNSIPDDLDLKLDFPEVAAAYIVLRQGE